MRHLQKIKEYNADYNDPIDCFISGKDNNTEIYIEINSKEKAEKLNHYFPLKSWAINNKLSIEMKLKKILELLLIKVKIKLKVF